MQVSRPVQPNDIVRTSHLAGLWRVVKVERAPASHSPIEVYQAVLAPYERRWSDEQRVVPLVSCKPVPPDIEDHPA